jgi:Family of unknown function (DUF5677)
MTDKVRPPIFDDVEKMVEEFVANAQMELQARCDAWELDVADREIHEVVGALLARQVTLAIQIARNPLLWNGHAAPVLLRAMADVYISLAWIFGDPGERSKKFILYGLGQLKLHLERRKAIRGDDPPDPQEEALIRHEEEWMESQRISILTDVDLGSWSDLNTRKMADEAGCLDFYEQVYVPFSGAAHSMWQHVGRYNTKTCLNPLHRIHRVPCIPDTGIDPDYLHLAAKYMRKTFALFDDKTGVKVDVPSAYEVLEDRFAEFAGKEEGDKSE